MTTPNEHNPQEIVRDFPADRINLIHQDGSFLGEFSVGLGVTLTLSPTGPDDVHSYIGWECYSNDGIYYADGSVTIRVSDNTAIDFDGAFELPSPVLRVLEEQNIITTEIR